MSTWLVFAVAAAILFGSNTSVTYAVGRSGFYDSRQRKVQIALIWLLPILGVLVVGGVLWSNYERPSSTRSRPEHKI